MTLNKKFGWHSGTVHAVDGLFRGDVTIQDDLVFGDVSAGVLGVTGGIDMTGTTTDYGIDINGATINVAEFRLSNAGTMCNTTSGRFDFSVPIWIAESAVTVTDEGR